MENNMFVINKKPVHQEIIKYRLEEVYLQLKNFIYIVIKRNGQQLQFQSSSLVFSTNSQQFNYISFIGSSVSGFIFPKLSDRKGRRIAILWSVVVAGISMVVLSLSSNILIFIFIFFIAGIGFNGFEIIVLVYISEVSAERFRNNSSVILTAVWAGTQIVFAPLAFYLPYWRHMTLIIAIPFLLIGYIFYKQLDETPRYLVSTKQYEKARQILAKISQYNNRQKFRYRFEGEMKQCNKQYYTNKQRISSYQGQGRQGQAVQEKKLNSESGSSIQHKLYEYRDMFKNKHLRVITFMLMYLWFYKVFVFYGYIFSVGSLGTKLHLTVIILGIAELFACVISAPLKLKMERKKSMTISVLLTAIPCLLMIFFPIPNEYLFKEGSWSYLITVNLTLACLGKFGISFFNNILITQTAELYPTSHRSLGYGITMTTGRVGSIVMPFIVVWFQYKGFNPITFFGILSLIALIVVQKMPETYGEEMLDNISDANKFHEKLIELEEVPKQKQIHGSVSDSEEYLDDSEINLDNDVEDSNEEWANKILNDFRQYRDDDKNLRMSQ